MATSGTKTAARLVSVDADNAGRRLDNFLLAELKGIPRTRVYRMIRKGEVRVNKGRCKPTTRLAEGDLVRIPPLQPAQPGEAHLPDRSKVKWILGQILHEDDHLLLLDKPSGLAVHGGSGISLGAIELLRAARPDCRYLELVHRLDRDTSGCLLVAKKRSALRNLHAQLREGQVGKIYLALLCGRWKGQERQVDFPLVVEHRKNGERHVRTGAEGKSAKTIFFPQERFEHFSLCQVELLTGRTHQIRVHAAAIGHSVAGDRRYGEGEANPAALQRLFLHAHSLEFVHPADDSRVMFTAQLPEALNAVLAHLRQD